MLFGEKWQLQQEEAALQFFTVTHKAIPLQNPSTVFLFLSGSFGLVSKTALPLNNLGNILFGIEKH